MNTENLKSIGMYYTEDIALYISKKLFTVINNPQIMKIIKPYWKEAIIWKHMIDSEILNAGSIVKSVIHDDNAKSDDFLKTLHSFDIPLTVSKYDYTSFIREKTQNVIREFIDTNFLKMAEYEMVLNFGYQLAVLWYLSDQVDFYKLIYNTALDYILYLFQKRTDDTKDNKNSISQQVQSAEGIDIIIQDDISKVTHSFSKIEPCASEFHIKQAFINIVDSAHDDTFMHYVLSVLDVKHDEFWEGVNEYCENLLGGCYGSNLPTINNTFKFLAQCLTSLDNRKRYKDAAKLAFITPMSFVEFMIRLVNDYMNDNSNFNASELFAVCGSPHCQTYN